MTEIDQLEQKIARLQRTIMIAARRMVEGTFVTQPSDDEILSLKSKPHNSLKEYDKALKKENRTPEEVEELAWVREWGETEAQKLYERQWNANVAAGTARGENPYRGKRFNESS